MSQPKESAPDDNESDSSNDLDVDLSEEYFEEQECITDYENDIPVSYANSEDQSEIVEDHVQQYVGDNVDITISSLHGNSFS